MEIENIVITLQNLNRIGRKTIIRKMNITSKMTCDIQTIQNILNLGLGEQQASVYSNQDIEFAMSKAKKY